MQKMGSVTPKVLSYNISEHGMLLVRGAVFFSSQMKFHEKNGKCSNLFELSFVIMMIPPNNLRPDLGWIGEKY